MRTTSNNIKSLKPNEIFVFGSNLSGTHAGGAALLAAEKFGAIEGQGIGIHGNSYAIPTKSEHAERTLTLDEIKLHVEQFISFANDFPQYQFLVTEIGCGIAGYDPKDIAPLFMSAVESENVHLPERFWSIINESLIIEGYKGFLPGFKCRDMQYAIGELHEMEAGKKLKVCPDNPQTEGGLHFCEHPLDVFEYYPPSTEKGMSKYATVQGRGEALKNKGGDSKVAVSKLFIHAEISLSALCGAAAKFILSKVNFKDAPATNTGDYSAATNTGSQSAATNTGDYSAATNTGDYSAATNTGSQSAATNTGSQSAATNTGDYSAATNTGSQSAATVEGKESVAISIGIEGKAKAKIGCFIVLADWKEDEQYYWHRTNVISVLVDGEKVKEDVFYSIRNGEITEVE